MAAAYDDGIEGAWARRTSRCRSHGDLHAPARLGQHGAERARNPVELGLSGYERRRDLHDRVATIVGAAEEALLEQAR